MEPGIDDATVLEIASREGAILVTADTDFGELVFRQSRPSVGVILIRLNELSPSRRAEMRFQGKQMPMLGSQNRPTLNDAEVNVLDYTEAIITDFTNERSATSYPATSVKLI